MAWFRLGRSSGPARGSGSSAPAGGTAVADRGTAAAAGRAPASGTGGVDFAAPPAPKGAWLLLPPLHVLQGPPLVLDHHFETKLASWQNPMYGLQPLGHIRSPEAPSGTVLVRPMSQPVVQGEAAPADAGSGPAPAPELTPPSAPLTLQAPVVREVPVPAPPPPRRGAVDTIPDTVAAPLPLPEPDPGFIAAVTEPVREFPHSYSRHEEELPAAPVAEGMLRTLGERDDARLGGLQLHLVPEVVQRPERPLEVEPVQAAVQVPALPEPVLPLAVPPVPQVQLPPEPEAAPLGGRVRIGEPIVSDSDAQQAIDMTLAPPVEIAAPAEVTVVEQGSEPPAAEFVAPLIASVAPTVDEPPATLLTGLPEAPQVSLVLASPPHEAPAPVAPEVLPPAPDAGPEAATPVAESVVAAPGPQPEQVAWWEVPVAEAPQPAPDAAQAVAPIVSAPEVSLAQPAVAGTPTPPAPAPVDVVVPPGQLPLVSRETPSAYSAPGGTVRAGLPAEVPPPASAPVADVAAQIAPPAAVPRPTEPPAAPPSEPVAVAPIVSAPEAIIVPSVTAAPPPAPAGPAVTGAPDTALNLAVSRPAAPPPAPAVELVAAAPALEAAPPPAPVSAPPSPPPTAGEQALPLAPIVADSPAITRIPAEPAPAAPATTAPAVGPTLPQQAMAPAVPTAPTTGTPGTPAVSPPVPVLPLATQPAPTTTRTAPPAAGTAAPAPASQPAAMPLAVAPEPPPAPAVPVVEAAATTPTAPVVEAPLAVPTAVESAPAPTVEELAPLLGDITAPVSQLAGTQAEQLSGSAEVTSATAPEPVLALVGAPRETKPVVVPIIGEREVYLQFQPEHSMPAFLPETPVQAPTAFPSARALTMPDPNITVRVGKGIDAAARKLEARAYSVDGDIHLPSSTFARGNREVEASIAHEFTHVLQQRQMGNSLPLESTVSGQSLEAEAATVEAMVRQTGELRLPTFSPAAADLAGFPLVQTPSIPTNLVNPLPLAQPPAPSIESMTVPVQFPAGPSGPNISFQDDGDWTAPLVGAVQRAPDDLGADGNVSGPATTSPPAPAPEPSPQQNAQLFEEIYPMIEARIRKTLRLHRDRAGKVTDMDL